MITYSDIEQDIVNYSLKGELKDFHSEIKAETIQWLCESGASVKQAEIVWSISLSETGVLYGDSVETQYRRILDRVRLFSEFFKLNKEI